MSTKGFTLVETLLALVIGTLVVLLAHQIFAAVSGQGRALLEARETLDHEANACRWLTSAFSSLDVSAAETGGFDGRGDRVAFTTWQVVPDGWFERRRVVLEREGDRLLASVSPGAPIVLRDSLANVAFDYLLEPGAEARWVRQWISPVSAPLAVRLRISGAGCDVLDTGCAVDTLLFLIKERG